jgi:NADPH:quinone reductase-like Zn-dependent oxidoreductase
MKAAVLHEVGGIPRYEEFPDPVARENEVVIEVKAVAVENVDKMVAAGEHYASKQYIATLPVIPGFDGVGALPDGTVVGFANPRSPYGALAEKTVVASDAVGPIPEGLDPATAVVLATAVTGMSIKTAAGFVPGEAVLIQGATGVAGRLAIYGSSKGLSAATMGEVYGQIVAWAQAGQLTFDLEKVPLSEIETAWKRTDLRGRRLVVVP